MEIETEIKKETEMEIAQEIKELVPMHQDGWPIFPEDNGGAFQYDNDDSIMRKAMEDVARPSIARAGDQRLATPLRQSGVGITQDMQGAPQEHAPSESRRGSPQEARAEEQ